MGASAQAPEIDWSQAYGGSINDRANSIVQVADGGYVVAGLTRSYDGDVSGPNGDVDAWVIKLGPQGNLIWQNCLGGSFYDAAHQIIETADGGYVFAGVTESDDGDVSGNNGVSNAWVVKLDISGELEWERAVGGTNHEVANAIVERSDGGFIVAGGSFSSTLPGHIAPGWDGWVFYMDNDGNVEQQMCHGTSDSEWFNDIALTTDEGSICVGQGPGSNGAWNDAWMVKFNSAGQVEWQKTYGGTQPDEAFAIQQTSDAGYVLVASTESNDGDITGHHGEEDAWMIKTDALGNIQWQRAIGGSANDRLMSVEPTGYGNFLAAGYTASVNGDIIGSLGSVDTWLLEVDEEGDLLWQKCFGGTGIDAAFDMKLINDGSIIMGGDSDSSNGDVFGVNGSSDAWVVKLKPMPLAVQDDLSMEMKVWPNPSNGYVMIQSSGANMNAVITITDAIGRVLLKEFLNTDLYKIDLSGITKGFHFITIQSENGVVSESFIVQ